MLSKKCIYGIRAVLYITLVGMGSFISIRDISNKLNISFYFLTKILQTLTNKDILESFKGPNGGVRLARPAEYITLMEIVLAIDGPKVFEQCILGLPGCGVMNPCPLHVPWMEALDVMKKTFNQTTLASLAERIRKENLRITELNNATLFEDAQ